jgi:hypothetical protein
MKCKYILTNHVSTKEKGCALMGTINQKITTKATTQ